MLIIQQHAMQLASRKQIVTIIGRNPVCRGTHGSWPHVATTSMPGHWMLFGPQVSANTHAHSRSQLLQRATSAVKKPLGAHSTGSGSGCTCRGCCRLRDSTPAHKTKKNGSSLPKMNSSSPRAGVGAAHDEPLGGLCRVWFARRRPADQSVPLGIAHRRAGFAVVCEAVPKLVPSLRIAGGGVVIVGVAVGVVESAFDPDDELNHRAVHGAIPIIFGVSISTLAIVPCRAHTAQTVQMPFPLRPEKSCGSQQKK